MSEKVVENIFVVMLVLIIFCFLSPFIQKIIYNAQISGAESSVYGSIDSIRILYIKESSKEKISLPLTVEYTKESYRIFSGNKEYEVDLEFEGQKPISGKIILGSDNEVSVVDLKYGGLICNKSLNGNVKCVRNSI